MGGPSKSALYTRCGDAGTTALADGTVVCKWSSRLEAHGAIDEANAHLGAALSRLTDDRLRDILLFLSHRLYNCSSALAQAAGPAVTAADTAFVERSIDVLDADTGPLHGFILCAGGEAASALHVARTVLRRAERQICRLYAEEDGDAELLRFVNRASDLLFAAARYASRRTGDVFWDRNCPVPGDGKDSGI